METIKEFVIVHCQENSISLLNCTFKQTKINITVFTSKFVDINPSIILLLSINILNIQTRTEYFR